MDAIISCPGHQVVWHKTKLRSHEYRYRSEAENVTCIINVCAKTLTMDATQVRRSAVVGDDETSRSNGEMSLSKIIVVSVIPTTKTQDSSRFGLLS